MKNQSGLKMLVLLVLILIGYSQVGMATAFPPYADKWDFIGKQHIGHHSDRDVIHVRSSKVLYTEIELRTDQANIDLHRCVIHFRDGARQKVTFRRDRRGGESHIIDLQGGARAIEKVVIWGSRDHRRLFRFFDKGTVELWGKIAKRKKFNKRNARAYRSNDRYNNSYDDGDYQRNYRGRKEKERNSKTMCPSRRN